MYFGFIKNLTFLLKMGRTFATLNVVSDKINNDFRDGSLTNWYQICFYVYYDKADINRNVLSWDFDDK
jgi:hypothetical protein